MTEWQLKKSGKSSEQNILFNQHIRNNLIENYYGAHKNFRTDFRNKKYKNVYAQLIRRKPSQEQYKGLYYQDLLISIIKTIELSFGQKDSHNQSLQPFFHFGSLAIKEYYWYFLKQTRIIDKELTIDPQVEDKITIFLTLAIDLSNKIAHQLQLSGDYLNSSKIYGNCYENFVLNVINSSTSNLLILKKCSQIMLNYAVQCLNAGKYHKAKQILRNGLKAQLNQLLLIKYGQRSQKKQNKRLKKYSSTLKLLLKLYLCLAVLHEKTNQIYESATLILDAVHMQDLIARFNPKAKKWVCNFQQNYAEQKIRYLQLKRICMEYFDDRFILSLKQTIKERDFQQKDKFSNKDGIFFNEKSYQNHITNNYLQSSEAKFKQKKQKWKSVDYKLEKINPIKEVRFKLNEKQFVDDKKEERLDLNEIGPQMDSLKNLTQLLNDESISASIQEIQRMKEVVGKKQLNKKHCKSDVPLKNSEKINDNQFLLLGQHFWNQKDQNSKRSKSSCDRNKSRHEIIIKKSRRKLSFNNISYLQANKMKSNSLLKNKQRTSSNQHQLRKKFCKDRDLYLQKVEQMPDNLNQVHKKIMSWHQKSNKIQTDFLYKKQRLKQKSRHYNGLQKFQSSSEIQNDNEFNTKKLLKFEESIQRPRGQGNYHSTKLRGVKLFKSFLIQNKTFFQITKIELYSTNIDLENQKKFLSFLTAQKPQKVEKYITKNHWQAKKNVEFFLKQIEDSNKKLKKKMVKKSDHHKKKQINYQMEGLELQNIENTPTNLFVSSLKARASQMIKYI